jgi:hypothetical protein
MASHEEIKERANKLLGIMPSYRFENEDNLSRIVLLKRKETRHENIIMKACD